MIAHHLGVPIEESHPPCWFVLSTAALYNAPEVQEFNYCNCDGEPVAGSELQPILLSTVTNAELATEMLSVGETAIHCVAYCVTLPHSHLLITDIVRSDVDALRTQVNALKARYSEERKIAQAQRRMWDAAHGIVRGRKRLPRRDMAPGGARHDSDTPADDAEEESDDTSSDGGDGGVVAPPGVDDAADSEDGGHGDGGLFDPPGC